MIVFLQNARLSFPDLWEAKAMEANQTPRFGADFIIGDDTKVLAVGNDGGKSETTMAKVLLAVANETWKSKGDKMLKALEPSKKCLRDGDARTTKEGDAYEGYEGRYYVTAKNKTRPTIIDRDRTPLTAEDGKPYSGCYVNAKIDVYGLADPKRKGVHAALLGVQFAKDGDAFGGGQVASADDFDELEMDDEVSDLV